ncbi:transporter [Arcobacter cloacae]|uniref:Transporter n=1 Tax=Arcobacter cloacae TaxID=1054034 RepID=A0AA94FEM8_9BACT|nr:transporter [Arcobacter cloacae]
MLDFHLILFLGIFLNNNPNNPLHGVKLESILNKLVDYYGWEELGYKINIRCFNFEPSINSSLKFLRKTPWARQKVEKLYLDTFSQK